jgi:hypothetical protein
VRYATLIALLIVGSASPALSESPTGWSPVIVATGEYGTKIRAQPIQHRPGRPLHVYGNTVRLFSHAGTPAQARPLRQIVFGTNRVRASRVVGQ